MNKSEKEIEAHLIRSVKNKKGLCMKWVSPGNAGVPDRLIIVPWGEIYFVELKAEGKRNNLSPLQKFYTEAKKLKL